MGRPGSSGTGDRGGADADCLIEIVALGNALKVTAIDPQTGAETSIVGDPSASTAHLAMLATRKLRRLQNQPATEASPNGADTSARRRRGILT